MIRILILSLLASVAYAQSYTCTDSKGNTLSATYTAAPVVTPPPSSSTSWVYSAGTFNWAGDWSFSASANYKDTSGGGIPYDIAIKVTGQYGGWQPYAPNKSFDLTPYSALTFALKPTQPNQQLQVYFMKVGDVPVGTPVNPLQGKYGPAPQVGVWTTYKIPLADFGVTGITILKFAIQDETGKASNTFYLTDVGFMP
jgi:hypothetical protein